VLEHSLSGTYKDAKRASCFLTFKKNLLIYCIVVYIMTMIVIMIMIRIIIIIIINYIFCLFTR